MVLRKRACGSIRVLVEGFPRATCKQPRYMRLDAAAGESDSVLRCCGDRVGECFPAREILGVESRHSGRWGY